MIQWALVIVLAGEPAPRVEWFATQYACEYATRSEVRALVQAGGQVVSATCQPARVALRAATGEVL